MVRYKAGFQNDARKLVGDNLAFRAAEVEILKLVIKGSSNFWSFEHFLFEYQAP